MVGQVDEDLHQLGFELNRPVVGADDGIELRLHEPLIEPEVALHGDLPKGKLVPVCPILTSPAVPDTGDRRVPVSDMGTSD